MYYQRIILYGSPTARETATSILQNLGTVKREVHVHNGCEVRLMLDTPLKETNLISLLRPSGIHGFRLAEY